MIANNPPITNVDQAEKQKAAQAIHLQSQMKAGEAPTKAENINKLGAAFTTGQAQTDLAASQAQAADEVAAVEREKQLGDIEQAHENIQDQEQLTKAIQDQKNQLIAMDIGITEDDFANEMLIRQLEEDGQFQNETQLNDLAVLTFESEEDYANMLQDSNQRVQQQLKDDEWELSVYDRAMQDKQMRDNIMKDEAKAEQVRVAREQAAEKARAAKEKAGKTKKMVGAAKMVGGAVLMYYTGGAVGGEMVASGASDVAAKE